MLLNDVMRVKDPIM